LLKAVSTKFPSNPRVGVACFFFLRFISPSLVAPEQTGVTIVPDAEARRGLVLVTKALQSAANGVIFKKERFMIPLNDWVEEAAAKVSEFYDKLASPPASVIQHPPPPPLSIHETQDDVKELHRLTVGVMEKISEPLSRLHIAVSNETGIAGSIRSVRDALVDALRTLGPPPTAPPAAAADVASVALDKCMLCQLICSDSVF